MQREGKLATGVLLKDVEEAFNKPFRHPVDQSSGHSPTEKLPKSDGSPSDHAECVDCHSPHQRIVRAGYQVAAVSGYSTNGQYLERATQEYEICLKCHSENEGRRRPEANLRSQFSSSARSMHPVSRPPTGIRQVSLTAAASAGRSMRCTDCHTNDDPNGPKGPHGSSYQFLLSGNYDIGVVTDESPLAFEFCYSCHDRTSILNDDSFPLHSEHIVGDPITGRQGTSCYTCHSAHSSQDYEHLISFNLKAVSPSGLYKMIRYESTGERSGECYLTCHGYSHEPARY
jgi:hypothetical protein